MGLWMSFWNPTNLMIKKQLKYEPARMERTRITAASVSCHRNRRVTATWWMQSRKSWNPSPQRSQPARSKPHRTESLGSEGRGGGAALRTGRWKAQWNLPFSPVHSNTSSELRWRARTRAALDLVIAGTAGERTGALLQRGAKFESIFEQWDSQTLSSLSSASRIQQPGLSLVLDCLWSVNSPPSPAHVRLGTTFPRNPFPAWFHAPVCQWEEGAQDLGGRSDTNHYSGVGCGRFMDISPQAPTQRPPIGGSMLQLLGFSWDCWLFSPQCHKLKSLVILSPVVWLQLSRPSVSQDPLHLEAIISKGNPLFL